MFRESYPHTKTPHAHFSWKTCAALLALTILSGTVPALAAVDKASSYQEMLGLAQQMRELKPLVATDPASTAAYRVAEGRYEALSLALGGDDPGHVTHGVDPSQAQPSTPSGAVALPAGCNTTTTNFADATPVVIPTGPAVVTSTIVVSGASNYLLDLNVTTQIQHTFAADLDITVTSPAGTVVTLTTDNGAGNDDVFNGTVWDDSANPGGQVPYTTNDGLVTDQAYVNLVTATPLVPEEALGAFIGEDPNGTWTLTISDDLAGDGGSLNGWSLDVTTLPSAPNIATVPTATQSTPVAIPTGPAVVTSTIVVAGAGSAIHDVDVTTFIQHTFSADLDVTLTSPAGTVVTLTTDNGAGNDDVFNGTVWDDSANPGGQVPYTTNDGLVTDQAYVNLTLASPLVPEEALAAFIGEDPNGTWTLTISDDLAGDGGSLNSWSLDIDTFTCASADLSITKTDGVTEVAAGQSTTYTITASNAGPTDAPASLVTDTFPAPLTACTWTCTGAVGGTCAANGTGDISESVDLPNGGSVTFNATCAVPSSVAAGMVIANTATVAPPAGVPDPVPGNDSATDTDTTIAVSDLAITKTDGVTSVMAGGSLTYTITASNAGPTDAPSSLLTDTFPVPLTACTWTCTGAGGGTCNANGTGDIAESVDLPSGGSVAFNATCTVPPSAAAGVVIANTATVAPPGGVSDPLPGNNSATDTDTTVLVSDLAISKTDGVTSVIAGGSLTYVIVASNAGPNDAAGSSVTDTFPPELSCTWTCAGSGTCTAAGSGNINDVVNLPSGSDVTYTATCAVAPATASGVVISNTATVAVAGGASDPNTGNNAATDTTTVIAGAGVSGTKSVSGSTIPGGAIVYTIVLSNAGPGSQGDNPGDEFVDVLPAQVAFNSVSASSGTASEAGGVVSWNGAIAVGASVTITINATVNAGAVGQINNQGTINFDSNGDGSNDSSTVTDNPATPGAADPTGFSIAQSVSTVGPIGLLVLALGLVAIWYRRERNLVRR